MRTVRDIVVAVFCVVVIVLTAGVVSESSREAMLRQRCAANLSSLGKAMQIYASQCLDELPKAGYRQTEWVPTLINWAAKHPSDAYGIPLDGSSRTAKVTVSSSLYLLVKYAQAKMDEFVCPGEPETTVFDVRRVPEELPEAFRFLDAWDFGGRYDERHNPSRHCSYAYHMPFGRYALTVANNLGMAVLADRNPWMDPNRVADPNVGWARFDPLASDRDRIRVGNSGAHQGEGQNVLFLDGHVSFHRQSTCGVDNDNIYTLATDTTETGRTKGRPPKVYETAQPLNRRDSVLVQDVPFDIPASASGM